MSSFENSTFLYLLQGDIADRVPNWTDFLMNRLILNEPVGGSYQDVV
jgi:hypothetical protein